jgi:phosphate transport system substrate-binding protein
MTSARFAHFNSELSYMTRKIIPLTAIISGSLIATSSLADFQRGYVSMMGSSTLVPFVKAAAERTKGKPPLIQASGTGGGIKLFCEGHGAEAPDIAIASRAMKEKEKLDCQRNGVNQILELKIGYDAVILAQSKKVDAWTLTDKEARLAFAKWIAARNGQMELNPNKNWDDVKRSLPGTPIELLGPPNTSATHDAFVDLISDLECKGPPWVPAGAREPTADMLRKCRSVREDGVYKEGRENDETHVARVADATSPKLGVFGYKMMIDNASKLRAIPINGVEPTYENISSKAYLGARPLYLYVKSNGIGRTPGLREFLSEITSENAWGDKGYLKTAGLITMSASERAAYAGKLKDAGVSSTIASPSSSSKPAAKKSTSSTKPKKK